MAAFTVSSYNKSIACINPHQTGFVGKGSDYLQLIRFWPSHAPGKGVSGGVKTFGLALLQPVCSVCASSKCFFINFSLCRCRWRLKLYLNYWGFIILWTPLHWLCKLNLHLWIFQKRMWIFRRHLVATLLSDMILH